jgi:hypothetical protein
MVERAVTANFRRFLEAKEQLKVFVPMGVPDTVRLDFVELDGKIPFHGKDLLV